MSSIITGHTCVNCFDQYAIIFGGFIETSQIYSNQTQLVDYSSLAITDMEIKPTEIDLKPCGRNFHSAIFYNNKMIIFGGKSNSYLNDVWMLDPDQGTWNEIKTLHHELISPRFGHSACLIKDSMFVFGGYDLNGFVSNELFELDLNSWEWSVVEFKKLKKQIIPRYFHSCCVYENSLIILGGKSSSNNIAIHDMIILKPEEKTYKVHKISERVARYGHCSFIEKNCLHVLGGCNRNFDFVSLWGTDLLSNIEEWKEMNGHYLSRLFSKQSKNMGPTFSTLVMYKVDSECSIHNFFTFGGKYQHCDSNVENIELANFAKLSNEVSRIIFEFLPMKELNTLCLVSRGTFSMVSQDYLWKRFALQKIYSTSKESDGMNAFSYIKRLENIKCMFRDHLIEIGKLKHPTHFEFQSKEDILKINIDPSLLKGTQTEIRVIFIGYMGVGKTSLQMMLTQGIFPIDYVPTMYSSNNVKFVFNDCVFNLEFIDTAGGQEYEIIRTSLYHPPPHLTVAMFSTQDSATFNNLKKYSIDESRWHSPKTPILMVGTKTDLRFCKTDYYSHNNRNIPVSTEQGKQLAQDLNCLSFIEISAKENQGIDELKKLIVNCFYLVWVEKHQQSKQKCTIQ